MGITSDGILFYGIHAGEDEADDWFAIAETLGVKHDTPDDEESEEWVEEAIGGWLKHGLATSQHCSYDFPIRIIQAASGRSWRGHAREINPDDFKPSAEQEAELTRLAEALGWEGPGLFLASLLG